MKKILVFGTFDNLHPGHLFFLGEARKRGEILVAVVAGDHDVHERKRRIPVHHQEERMRQLSESGLADVVIPADKKLGSFGVIIREKPDLICLGHDQIHLKESLSRWLRSKQIEIPLIIIPPHQRDLYNSTSLNKPLYTRKTTLFYSLMILSMGLWGLSWISAKIASKEALPSLLVFWRVFVSLLAFIPLTIIRKENPFADRKGVLWTMLAAICLALYNQVFFRGLVAGLASRGGVIVTTLNPLFAFLLSLGFSGRQQKTSSWQIIGLILGLAGGLLFVEPWLFSPIHLIESGNLYFLIGALLWAGLTVSGQQALKRTPLFAYNALLYGMTTLMTLPFVINDLTFTGYSLIFWFQIIYMGLFSGAFATAMYFFATRNIGAARAGAFTFMVPVSAVFFSWLILGEKPGWITLGGGIICLTAIALINATRQKETSS